MSLVLAIESSAVTASVALAEDGKIIGSEFLNNGLTHSETLLPMVQRVMGERAFSALDAIAVTKGPGSFTGVRIGVAAVKGLAFPNGTPCIGVSTLKAIACNFCDEETETVVCAVMDARRMQFYNALFRVKGRSVERLTEDRAIALEQLREELKTFDSVVIAGDGAALCSENIGLDNCALAQEEKRFQRAEGVIIAAADEALVAPAQLIPTYLRMSQAERELKLKMKTAKGEKQ